MTAGVGTGRLRMLAAILTIVSMICLATAVGLMAIQLARAWLVIRQAGDIESLVGVIMFALAFPVLGWVILRQSPDHRLGWIYLAIGLLQAVNLLASSYSTCAYWIAAGNLPLAPELSWIAGWAWVPAFTLFSTLGILLFPTGRLPSRRWSPIVLLAAVAFLLLFLPTAIASWPYRGLPLERAIVLEANPPPDPALAMATTLQAAGQILLLVPMIGSVASLIVRFRRSGGVERQQIKWFTFAAALDVVIVVGWILSELPVLLAVLSAVVFGLTLPAATAIAILRYRLYDIDRIISRTVSYAVLTAILAAVYGAGFLVLQAALAPFTSGGGPVAVAASTLVVFGLFSPVRRRIQALVDRRFNRSRYDAERTLAFFGTRLVQEVDLARLSSGLAEVVDETLEPSSVRVWLKRGVS